MNHELVVRLVEKGGSFVVGKAGPDRSAEAKAILETHAIERRADGLVVYHPASRIRSVTLRPEGWADRGRKRSTTHMKT